MLEWLLLSLRWIPLTLPSKPNYWSFFFWVLHTMKETEKLISFYLKFFYKLETPRVRNSETLNDAMALVIIMWDKFHWGIDVRRRPTLLISTTLFLVGARTEQSSPPFLTSPAEYMGTLGIYSHLSFSNVLTHRLNFHAYVVYLDKTWFLMAEHSKRSFQI